MRSSTGKNPAVKLDRETHKRLREYAFHRNVNMQDVADEAILRHLGAKSVDRPSELGQNMATQPKIVAQMEEIERLDPACARALRKRIEGELSRLSKAARSQQAAENESA